MLKLSKNNVDADLKSLDAHIHSPSYTFKRFFLSQSAPPGISNNFLISSMLFFHIPRSSQNKPTLALLNSISIFCPIVAFVSLHFSYASTHFSLYPICAYLSPISRNADCTSSSPKFSFASFKFDSIFVIVSVSNVCIRFNSFASTGQESFSQKYS